MMDVTVKRVRMLYTGFGILLAVSFLSGMLAMVSGRPAATVADAANQGEQPLLPAPPSRLMWLHENAGLFLVILIVVGGGWLMMSVRHDWIGSLALTFAAACTAGFTGWWIVLDAIELNGVFERDLRGVGFVFDPDFESAVSGERRFSATTYRVLLLVHILAAIGVAVGLWRSKKALDAPRPDIWDERQRARDAAGWTGSRSSPRSTTT